MSRTQIILLSVILLMFLVTGIWKNASFFAGEEPDNGMQEARDRATVAEFWDHYNRASGFLNEGSYDSAAVHYEKALQRDDKHAGALYYLGNARLLLKEFEEAETHWRRLAELNPSSARAWMQLGTLYFCMDEENDSFDPERAEDHFNEARNLNREDTGPPLYLSKIAILDENLDRAEQYVDAVLASNFMSYQALFLKGYLEWGQGQDVHSGEYLSEAVNLYEKLTRVTMAGEGATETGFMPMLSGDMFCDFFGTRIEKLLAGYGERSSAESQKELMFTRFERTINGWRSASL